jgi:hypothetical protein
VVTAAILILEVDTAGRTLAAMAELVAELVEMAFSLVTQTVALKLLLATQLRAELQEQLFISDPRE